MTDIKSWYRSKTVNASLVILFLPLLSYFGLEISTEDANGVIRLFTELGTAVAALVAIYGRVTAKHKVSK